MSLLDALLLDPVPFDFWIALRSDGINGSGTQSDPYDGSNVKSGARALGLTNSDALYPREATASCSDLSISDLTVDCNLQGQPFTQRMDYAEVTCSAISVVGGFVRIHRVKAINWGAQTAAAEAFVIAVSGSHPDFPTKEGVNPEDAITYRWKASRVVDIV